MYAVVAPAFVYNPVVEDQATLGLMAYLIVIDQLLSVSSVALNELSVIKVHCPFGTEYKFAQMISVDR